MTAAEMVRPVILGSVPLASKLRSTYMSRNASRRIVMYNHVLRDNSHRTYRHQQDRTICTARSRYAMWCRKPIKCLRGFYAFFVVLYPGVILIEGSQHGLGF